MLRTMYDVKGMFRAERLSSAALADVSHAIKVTLAVDERIQQLRKARASV